MIVELEDDLEGDFTTEDLSGIELLAQARREGHHVLTGRKGIFEHLSKEPALSEGARKILARSGRRQVQKGDLLKNAVWRMKVSRDRGPLLEDVDGVSVITLRASHFRRLSAASAAVILGENVRDARLMLEMARVYASSKRMPEVKLRCRLAGGGGTTTADSFRGYREESRLCLCVVDSDRKAPEGEMGTTAVEVLGEVEADSPWAAVVILECREAENTLPTEIVAKAVRDNHQHMQRVPMLSKLDRSVAGVFVRSYCNLKRGTQLKNVLSFDDAARASWLRTIPLLTSLEEVNIECVNSVICLNPDNCDCWIMRGFGRDLLKCSLQALHEMTTRQIDQVLCDATRPHWLSTGAIVFSWACGTEEVRI